MQADVGVIDVLAMLALFITGFVLWVAWELMTGRKGLSLALAILTFVATAALAGAIGLRGPVALLLAQVAVALVVVRVANAGRRGDTG